jgi:hypothetical protein
MRDAFESLKLQAVQQQTERTTTTQVETRYGKKVAYIATWVKWAIGGIIFVAWRIVELKYFGTK